MTVETTVTVMSQADAERLTNRITLMAGTIREGVEKVADLVAQAKAGQAHVALGYASWTAYLADVLGREPIRLDGPQRKELVSYLAGEGMSTRAIAPIVGVTKSEVSRDLQVSRSGTPSPEPGFRVDRETGEIAAVVGLDGKTYTRPTTPAAPRAVPRRPITDQFIEATYELTKATERLERLVVDDRFTSNADQVAVRNHSDLIRASEALARVLDRLATAAA